jgi:hypothetical protein
MNRGEESANIAIQHDGAVTLQGPALVRQLDVRAIPAFAQNEEATPNEHDVLFGRGGK